MFSRADFGRLAQQLAGIAGSFIMTVNDMPETRQSLQRSTRSRSA